MRILIAAVVAGAILWLAGCDLAKDTAQETEQGAQGAASLAEKMSQGTVGAEEDGGE